MKAIFFLSILFVSVHTRAQYAKKTDVATMITAALKPLQKTIGDQAKAITDLSNIKSTQDKLISALTTRLAISEAKNSADSVFKIQQAIWNTSLKSTMDSSLIQLDGYFLINGKVATLNIPAIAPQIKNSLEGKLP